MGKTKGKINQKLCHNLTLPEGEASWSQPLANKVKNASVTSSIHNTNGVLFRKASMYR